MATLVLACSPAPDDELGSLATRGEDRAAFLRVLDRDGIVVLTSIPDSQGKVTFLDYADGDQRVFPIFSSEDRAVEFLRSMPATSVTAYQRLSVTAAFLLENDWSRSRLVLNPRSRYETEISAADLVSLRRRTPRR